MLNHCVFFFSLHTLTYSLCGTQVQISVESALFGSLFKYFARIGVKTVSKKHEFMSEYKDFTSLSVKSPPVSYKLITRLFHVMPCL